MRTVSHSLICLSPGYWYPTVAMGSNVPLVTLSRAMEDFVAARSQPMSIPSPNSNVTADICDSIVGVKGDMI